MHTYAARYNVAMTGGPSQAQPTHGFRNGSGPAPRIGRLEPLDSLEQLRRDLAARGKPRRWAKGLRCQKGHPLFWLVPTEQGLAPVAKDARRGTFSFRGHDGRLMTLADWPAGESLPLASCACFVAVPISVYQARSWLDAPRDTVTYAP